MANDSSPAPAPVGIRRYPVLGGAAAWCLPLLAVLLRRRRSGLQGG